MVFLLPSLERKILQSPQDCDDPSREGEASAGLKKFKNCCWEDYLGTLQPEKLYYVALGYDGN